MTQRHILATSGGFRQDGRWNLVPGPLVKRALELTGKDRPRICYLGTAMGDDPAERILQELRDLRSDIHVLLDRTTRK